MRKLMILLGIVEDDEFESIVATFQTTVDKLTALIDRKKLVASDKSIEAAKVLRDAQEQVNILDAQAAAANDIVTQAETVRAKIAALIEL